MTGIYTHDLNRENIMNTATVLEIVTYKATADKAALVKINDKFQTFVEGTDGFIKRTLAYNEEDNSWTDLVYWRSLDDAKKASEVMMELPIMGEFMSLVQAESISMQHQEIVL
jgi:hypothetical protein